MAEWIWFRQHAEKEEYGRFHAVYTGHAGLIRIAAETDYAAYINGKLIGFGAFAGYPNEKYFDTLDPAEAETDGENTLEITVRYEGVNSLTHIDNGAGLWFEADNGLCSSQEVLSAPDTRYAAHAPRLITGQLGYASDMTQETEVNFHASYVTGRTCRLLPRPVPRLEYAGDVKAERVPHTAAIYDVGRETAGYISLVLDAEKACTVRLSYGEHLRDGHVARVIGHRNFSLTFECRAGENRFFQPFVRVAGRYFEFDAPEGTGFKVVSLALREMLQPQVVKPHPFTSEDKRIYDTCVRTLRLSMHNHYEDCPWREQALYVLDSRNQMLCGYEAFESAAFQRANLVFMSKGRREDGMLELTFPAVQTPAIPFFSVMYPVTVKEYVEHTGDTSIIPGVWDTIAGIMACLSRAKGENGLIRNFPKPYWNFYEWIEGSDGAEGTADPGRQDLILNAAYVLSAEAAMYLAEKGGYDLPDPGIESVRRAIKRAFKRGDTFVSSTRDNGRTRLGNAMAVLAGAGDGKTVDAIVSDEDLAQETLSMAGFVYDAIGKTREDAGEIILGDIRKKYGYMLRHGATSFWETIRGSDDFDGAGSLCHGWSAIPIVYLWKYLK